MNWKSVCLYFFFVSSIAVIYAQAEHQHDKDSTMSTSPSYLPVTYSIIEPVEFKELQFIPIDTGIIEIHHYDPLFFNQNLYQTLGISGQAHKSMIFDYYHPVGFRFHTFPFPLYFKEQNDLKFYKLESTYTKLSYTFGLPKENTFDLVFAQFVKNLTAIINLYANYNDGYFLHQATRNLVADGLLHYEIPSQIYGVRVSYILNNANPQQNGGLLDAEKFIIQNDTSIIRPDYRLYHVKTPNAISGIRTHDVLLQQYVNIKNKKKHYFGTFTHTINYKSIRHSYFNLIDTTIQYAALNFASDSTIDTIRTQILVNTLQWSNYEPFALIENKNNFFRLAGGVMHEYIQKPFINSYFNTVTPFVRSSIRLFRVIDIYGSISYAFGGYNTNDAIAHLKADWALNREKSHFVGLNADFYRVEPDYTYMQYSSNHYIWENEWMKQNIVKLSAFWTRKSYRASLNYFMLNNFVLLGTDCFPVQLTKSVSLVQASIFAPVRIGGFGFISNLNMQYSSNDSIQIPLFAGKVSTFYVFRLFKRKLQLQVGVDVSYNTSYYADSFSPAFMAFYTQDMQKVGNFWYFDTYVNFRVERIYFFARFGNLLAPFQSYNMFTTPDYPMKDVLISIGINWRFHD